MRALLLAILALFAIDASAQPSALFAGSRPKDTADILGGGGPCGDFKTREQLPFMDELLQPMTFVQTGANFVNGTDDAEFENSGVVVTAIGTPNDFVFGPNANEQGGMWFFQTGGTANTGFNMRFNRTPICTALPCFPITAPSVTFSLFGGHDLCWVARVGVLLIGDPTELWDSSFVVGMNNVDTSIMAASTGALTKTGSGANVWDGDGFLFHLSRAGVLTFHVGRAADATPVLAESDTTPSGATVDLEDEIEATVATDPYYAYFLDLGVRMHSNAGAGGANGPDGGTVQAWYRRVNLPSETPEAWQKFGAVVSGVNTLPATDANDRLYTTMEFISGGTNSTAPSRFEFFLSHLGGFYTREEMQE